MRYTINGTLGGEQTTATVTVEQRDEWHGFSSYVRAYHSEAGRGCEYVVVYYNEVHLKTPYCYDVQIKRLNGKNHQWPCGKGDSALVWLRRRHAKFGLGCASVEIDSVRRVITITVNSEAEVIEEDTTGAVAA